jgi:hypothetical protein
MKPFKLTEESYRDLDDDNCGFCRKCREVAYGVEPDACNYECENCGEEEVFGAAELLLMGDIIIVDTEEEEEDEDEEQDVDDDEYSEEDVDDEDDEDF